MGESKAVQGASLSTILVGQEKALRKIGGKHLNASRLMALAIQATQRNPLLGKSSATSVINFCMKCAEWQTDRVGAGGVWPVPYYNSKTGLYDMQPIPDWRLMLNAAKKTGAIKHGKAEAVHENDHFEYEFGMEPRLIHKPALSDRGKVTHVYFVYTLPDGARDFVVMDAAECMAVKARSKAKDGPWKTDEEQMMLKTVSRRGLKPFEGASSELTSMFDADNVVNGFPALELGEPIAEPKELPASVPETPPPAASGAEKADTYVPPAEQPNPGTDTPQPGLAATELFDKDKTETGICGHAMSAGEKKRCEDEKIIMECFECRKKRKANSRKKGDE